MTERPSGTVTFLFTDMEGSTRAWESHPSETKAALQRHDEIVKKAVDVHAGTMVLERGEGDSVFAVFGRASDAVAAACEIQRTLRREAWPENVPLRVRIAIHTGEAGADYRGVHVNRAARIRAIAHGEQVLLSGVTAGIVRGTLPEGASLIDLGQHRLRDVSEMEHVFQLAHPDLRADFPPLKSLSNFRQNLPVQLTSFVGREHERSTVRALIEQHRLVTLTGSGGCGKTRLAIQVGADELEQFRDGVRFVDLAPLSDPSLVADAIAAVVGAKVRPGTTVVDALVEALEGTKTLLILDNCEHVAPACADAVSALLRIGNSNRVLATSREPLGLPGESRWRVPSLSIPDETTAIEEIAACEAIQLFVDRAAAARQGFMLSSANATAIVGICRTLEGVPLAIELAAARAKALSPREILDRLSDRFRLLTGGGRGRHQTLRSAIDWSYDLLSEQERALFRRLSVFAGGFDLAAVEAIWPAGDPLDYIEQLVDKSLVTVEPLADESVRYRLLETLRRYGAERLAQAGEEEETREHHFAYYLSIAEHAYDQRIENEAASLARLEIDHDDFRAALTWARQRPRDLLRLASALGWFWHLRSNYREGRRWLEEAIAAAPDRSREVARAYWALGMILTWQGQREAGRSLAEQSFELWRAANDSLELALALESIGWSHFLAGDYNEALRSMEECVELYRKLDSKKLVTRGRVAVGQMLAALGDVEHTEPLARETLAEGRALGEPKFVHYSLHYLGDCALWRSDGKQAVHIYADSLRAALDYGNEMEAATEMQGMAMALAGSGRETEAFRLLGATCAVLEELQTTMVDEIAFWVHLKDRYFTPARERIGVEAAEAAEREGRAMGWKRAIAYAFELAAMEK